MRYSLHGTCVDCPQLQYEGINNYSQSCTETPELTGLVTKPGFYVENSSAIIPCLWDNHTICQQWNCSSLLLPYENRSAVNCTPLGRKCLDGYQSRLCSQCICDPSDKTEGTIFVLLLPNIVLVSRKYRLLFPQRRRLYSVQRAQLRHHDNGCCDDGGINFVSCFPASHGRHYWSCDRSDCPGNIRDSGRRRKLGSDFLLDDCRSYGTQ